MTYCSGASSSTPAGCSSPGLAHQRRPRPDQHLPQIRWSTRSSAAAASPGAAAARASLSTPSQVRLRRVLPASRQLDDGRRTTAPLTDLERAASHVRRGARCCRSAARGCVYLQDGPSLRTASRRRRLRAVELITAAPFSAGAGDAARPRLLRRQLHRGHARGLLLPRRRIDSSTASPGADRMINPTTPLDEAAYERAGLDAKPRSSPTCRSGLPLDLLRPTRLRPAADNPALADRIDTTPSRQGRQLRNAWARSCPRCSSRSLDETRTGEPGGDQPPPAG